MSTITTNDKANNNAVVAIYKSHTEAEAAVKELQRSSFDMKKLSIVGRDEHTDEHVVGYYNAGDRMKYWGKAGAFWGGIWGMLFGSAFFLIPGVGPLLVAGIPKNSILQYETALKTGKYVLIAHGTSEEATRAREIINRTNPEALEEHQPCCAAPKEYAVTA
jgi:hypothetical protein